MSTPITEAELALASARRDLSAVRARQLLHGALRTLERESGNAAAALLASAIYAELAGLESNAEHRLTFRRKAIRSVVDASATNDTALAVAGANRRVDLSYDVFANSPLSASRHELAEARREINAVLHASVSQRERALLLAQQSSVIRAQARLADQQSRKATMDEAVRCARAAVTADPGISATLIELGQSLWGAARWARSDDEYFRDMNEAQAVLEAATAVHDPLAWLVLARFFRQTYRPLEAVAHYKLYASIDDDRRRVLRESYIAAEAAMQLWFNGYDDVATDDALLFTQNLCREALDAGYENARILVDLALVEATRGDSTVAELTLRRLATASSDSWLQIVESAIKHVEGAQPDRVLTAFVVGLTDAHVWNGLGTYAAAIAQDADLAIRLYDVGRKLDPRNPVILTNLARKLLAKKDSASLGLADKYLRTAAENADHAFVWWRSVRDELNALRGERRPLRRQPHLTGFKELKAEYAALHDPSLDSGDRGALFEKLVVRLLQLTFPDAMGSHRVQRRQIDGAFTHDGSYYRVECKWHSRALGESDIDSLARRLETAEARGVFMSMSPYTERAIERAKQIAQQHVILLFGPDDLDEIFGAKTRFETVLERKLSWFRRFAEPYDQEVQKKHRRKRGARSAVEKPAG